MSKTFLIQSGDIILSSSTSRPIMITDRDKLSQDLAEATSISVQANGFGFGLDNLIGQLADPISLRTDLSRRIRDGVDAIKRLQNQYVRTARPDNERISRLVRVDVNQVASTKTTYVARFDVLTVSGDLLQQTGVLSGS